MSAFRGRVEEVKEALIGEGITCGVSIGRRAPMHRVHKNCVLEIAEAGLTPIIVVGSTNGADSPLFDPVRNPLTTAQQIEQMKRAVPEYATEGRVLTLDDMDDQERWFDKLFKLLGDAGFETGSAAVHYRAKAADAKPQEGFVKPLSAYMSNFLKRGMSIWESFNRDHADDPISASDIRLFDLDKLTEEQKGIMVSPDYISDLARQARDSNPDKEFLQQIDLPLTVFDLTLDRFRREAGISTKSIFNAAAARDVKSLGAAGLELHKRKYFPETSLPATPARRMTP